MDGKGNSNDNLFVERLWRLVKYKEVYLKAYQDRGDARISPDKYFRFYNTERPIRFSIAEHRPMFTPQYR
jgi:putative transposase